MGIFGSEEGICLLLLLLRTGAGGEDATFGHFGEDGLCDGGGAAVDFSVVAPVDVDAGPDEEGEVEEAGWMVVLAKEGWERGGKRGYTRPGM